MYEPGFYTGIGEEYVNWDMKPVGIIKTIRKLYIPTVGLYSAKVAVQDSKGKYITYNELWRRAALLDKDYNLKCEIAVNAINNYFIGKASTKVVEEEETATKKSIEEDLFPIGKE